MQKSSIYLIFTAASIGCISISYFLSLAFSIPFILSAILIVVALYLLFRWMNNIETAPDNNSNRYHYFILLAGVMVLAYKSSIIGTKHGAWDAWAIWNLHARYLADASHWKKMFLNTDSAHADYPLALPAFLGFMYRFINNQQVLNYTIHFIILTCIPIIIYLQTYQRSFWLPLLVFIMFCTNDFYIQLGTYQLADTLVALYLLSAMVAITYIDKDKRLATVCTAMLGCCLWTKNEGLLIALLFQIFHFKSLYSRQYIKYSIAGISIPLIIFVLFKTVYAPYNDILHAQDSSTLSRLMDWGRYEIILGAWYNNITQHYYAVACVLGLYLLFTLWRKTSPDKNILFILSCCIGYTAIYAITPLDLKWHLNTSLDRLIHQLMPATVYSLLLYYTGGTMINFKARFGANQQPLQ